MKSIIRKTATRMSIMATMLISTVYSPKAEASQTAISCSTLRNRLFSQNWQTIDVRANGTLTFEWARTFWTHYNLTLSTNHLVDNFHAELVGVNRDLRYNASVRSFYNHELDNSTLPDRHAGFALYRDRTNFITLTQIDFRNQRHQRDLRDLRCYELITGSSNRHIHYLIVGRLEYQTSGLDRDEIWTILINN